MGAITPTGLAAGKELLNHEFSHQVTRQMSYNPYGGSIPVWLNEGLAVYAEGPLNKDRTSRLKKAIADNKLVSVRSLASPFSSDSDTARLSYAESFSIVEFLINNYGQSKIFELLNTYKQGSTYDKALQKVYGFDMDGLNSLWRDYIPKQYSR